MTNVIPRANGFSRLADDLVPREPRVRSRHW